MNYFMREHREKETARRGRELLKIIHPTQADMISSAVYGSISQGGILMPKPKKCLRCGHTWISIKPKPKRCPHCISPYWNKPRKIR